MLLDQALDSHLLEPNVELPPPSMLKRKIIIKNKKKHHHHHHHHKKSSNFQGKDRIAFIYNGEKQLCDGSPSAHNVANDNKVSVLLISAT